MSKGNASKTILEEKGVTKGGGGKYTSIYKSVLYIYILE